jgi:hypothetical protein
MSARRWQLRPARRIVPRPVTPDSPVLSRLIEATRTAYSAVVDILPSDRGHCTETAMISSLIARRLGIPHRICAGPRPWRDAADRHWWIEVGNFVLHSPARGQVELLDGSDFRPTNALTVAGR